MSRSLLLLIVAGILLLALVAWKAVDFGTRVAATASRHPSGIVVYSDGDKKYVSYQDLLKGSAGEAVQEDQAHAYTPAGTE